MRSYAFFWSPEGRRLATYRATSRAEAVASFRRDYPEHAKYMGEVYVEVDGVRG
jgi:hypothetical protein